MRAGKGRIAERYDGNGQPVRRQPQAVRYRLLVKGPNPAAGQAVTERSQQQVFDSRGGVLQAVENHTVDMILAILLLLGSTVGAQFGARLSRRLKGDQLKIILASVVLLVMVQMLFGLIVSPSVMLSYKGGH